MINELLAFGLAQVSLVKANQREWKERILKEFEETKNMPRKKKKQRRKELNLDWSIASWSPFEY